MGKLYGHRFTFDKKGNVLFYNYYVGNQHYSSYEPYYRDGCFLKEYGSIFADYVKEDKTVKLMFINAFHDSIKVTITNKKLQISNLALKPSLMSPMVLIGTVPLEKNNDYRIVTTAKEKKSGRIVEYVDTLDMD